MKIFPAFRAGRHTQLLAVLLAVGACSAAHASTSFSFPNLNGVLYSAGEPIGPYAGSLGGAAVTIFCDDFNDNVPVPTTYNVDVTAANATDLSLTRFGSANYNTAYAAGTTLYEQIAWMFTQMVSPGESQANQIAIQEAVWHMTSSTPSAVSTVSLAKTGANLTYLQWITAAQSDYNKTVSGFTTPNFSNWMILTDVANASTKTVGTGNQELLAYYTTSGPPTNNSVSSTPEPGTSTMLAGGIALVFLGTRRRSLNGAGKSTEVRD